MAGTFPGRKLLLDVKDVGDDSLTGVRNLEVMDVRSWDDFEMAYWYLKRNPDEFDSLIVDTMTQLQQLAVQKVSGEDKDGKWGAMSKKQWGEVSQMLKTAVINLRDLPMQVAFIAQDRTFNVGEEDGDNGLDPEIGPALSPSVAKALNAAVHVVANTFIRRRVERVRVKNPPKGATPFRNVERIEFCARLGPNPLYVTKVRKAKAILLPSVVADPTYEKLMLIIKGDYRHAEAAEAE